MEHHFNHGYDILCVNAAANVVRDRKLVTSKSGFDAACTFRRVSCGECRSLLGKIYECTIPKLDHFRNLFTLENHQLVTYRLGQYYTTSGMHVKLKYNAMVRRERLTCCNLVFAGADISYF